MIVSFERRKCPGSVLEDILTGLLQTEWVAAVWTIYRKGALMMAEAVCRCARLLPSDQQVEAAASRVRAASKAIIGDLVASVPYLLLLDVSSGWDQSGRQFEAGPPVGGILLMHPLHIVSTFTEVVSAEEKEYFRRCLSWMSTYMGLGQATELHRSREAGTHKTIADAHMIVWAGMLM